MNNSNNQTSAGRFILQESDKYGYFVCTDRLNQIVMTFKSGDINNTQVVTPLNDNIVDPLTLARFAKEMIDWLITNHKNKL